MKSRSGTLFSILLVMNSLFVCFVVASFTGASISYSWPLSTKVQEAMSYMNSDDTIALVACSTLVFMSFV